MHTKKKIKKLKKKFPFDLFNWFWYKHVLNLSLIDDKSMQNSLQLNHFHNIHVYMIVDIRKKAWLNWVNVSYLCEFWAFPSLILTLGYFLSWVMSIMNLFSRTCIESIWDYIGLYVAWKWQRHFSWLNCFGQINLPCIYPIVNPLWAYLSILVLSSLQALSEKSCFTLP